MNKNRCILSCEAEYGRPKTEIFGPYCKQNRKYLKNVKNNVDLLAEYGYMFCLYIRFWIKGIRYIFPIYPLFPKLYCLQ
jgi:hypothetical protein